MTSRVVDVDRLGRLGAWFRRAVDAGELPGWTLSVHDGERVVHADSGGLRDVEAGLPVEPSTRFRVWSMTKPVVAVAALILLERGELDLRAPVAEFVPEFADTPVLASPSAAIDDVVPQTVAPALWHLATHTAGLTYSFFADAASARHRAGHLGEIDGPLDLAGTCRELARIPLLFSPGSAWNYSMGLDVLGRVIEVVTGAGLDVFLHQEVFAPLGMDATGFVVPPQAAACVAPLYMPARSGGLIRATWADRDVTATPVMLSGGGGLYSTLADYQRFVAMLAAGGTGPGARVLSPRALALLAADHLPGTGDLQQQAVAPLDGSLTGLGHGLGVAVVRSAAARKVLSRGGQFWWNGAGGGTFLVDPASGVSATFLTSVRSPVHAPRWETALQTLLNQALLR